MLFSANLRPDGIIFGRSVGHVATFVVPKFYTMWSQIGWEQASAVFPFFTCRTCYTIGYGGLSVWVTIVPFYVWKLPFLTESSLNASFNKIMFLTIKETQFHFYNNWISFNVSQCNDSNFIKLNILYRRIAIQYYWM